MRLSDQTPSGRTAVYRADIDGLRGISVLAVVAFHAFPDLVPGGFIGVDVFFVISGFLISGIIFDEMRLDAFSLRAFYARRIRRIFPALVLVLTVTALIGWWSLLPQDMLRLGRQLLSSAAFVANLYFWYQSGYFSPDAQSFPLLHLWSLGVEEQFYIVWPLILLLLRRRPDRIFAAILVIAALSFLLNILSIDHHEANFYSPLTRAWELMLGAAVAWLVRHYPSVVTARQTELLRILGLLAILSTVFMFNSRMTYPGWLALVPTIGSALLVATSPEKSGVTSYLTATGPIVATGRISYPLYLWHWPLLVLAEAFKFGALTVLERGLVVTVSFILAGLTYEWVEKPIRVGLAGRAKIASLGAGMVAVAVVGVTIINARGFETRFPPEIRALADVPAISREQRQHECFLDLKQETTFADSCVEAKRPLVLTWGDSTIAALMPGLRKRQQEVHFGLAQFNASSCPPQLSVEIPGYPACRGINEAVLQKIALAHPDVVLMQSRGTISPDDEMRALKRTFQALHELGVPHIVLLGPAPVWKRTLAGEALSYFIKHHAVLPQRSANGVANLWDDAKMRAFANGQGVEYISTWDALCNAEGCLTRLSDAPTDLVIYDAHHFTEGGAIFFINKVWDRILPPHMQQRAAQSN
ncbi:peptidoglycan/LPS O-acetylase OafA/YrhL [Bradyrhizobium japonicum]|uniref:acyltransferase family protein n=1 Tax=Bradyrhizobium japonicum TaxID=375 RepID=UPI0021677F19|nr:acyltransferase family protein [Bradyrhizobium japonicum]MCS3503720.1 peptidoglycan/LPS O-acetylase OafA/YrhL [Bradyrhizobium japonicum]MCS3963561.1 peptidoglycan/LPS O-acetylase OafA/YrhL [Bradyrhizobium japonicum]MCS3995874.1 peptidoglycan/LPS O-acetylase OafA/YrhL [Bradyrhizobium japonicum]